MARSRRRVFELTGMNGVLDMLKEAGDKAVPIASSALYEGAKDLADGITARIDALKTEPYRYVREGDNPRKLSPYEKELLKKAVPGIAKFSKTDSTVSTSISMGADAGYVFIKDEGGKKTGTPVIVIARSIEHGTSFRVKQPFFRTGINKAKTQAESDMKRVVEEKVQQLINNNEN